MNGTNTGDFVTKKVFGSAVCFDRNPERIFVFYLVDILLLKAIIPTGNIHKTFAIMDGFIDIYGNIYIWAWLVFDQNGLIYKNV